MNNTENTLYFMNSLYDDNIISAMLGNFRNSLYQDILDGKGYIQDTQIENGDINDLRVELKVNTSYNISDDSYRLHFNHNILIFNSENEFLKKYEYGEVISFNTILKDTATFSHIPFFFIGDNLVLDIKIVIERQESIIFISPSNLLTLSDLKTKIEKSITWSLMLSRRADYYEAYMSRSNLITDNKIYVHKLTEGDNFNRKTKNNSWTAYISNSSSSVNLLTATNVNLNEDSDGLYFKLSNEFKEYIYRFNGNLKCFIINDPVCTGNGIYLNSENTEPVFQIPYLKNPIPASNLIIWKYDSNTKRKMHPFKPSVSLKHPNIYDLSNLYTSQYFENIFNSSKNLLSYSVPSSAISESNISSEMCDLYIEWLEPMDDISSFDYYYKDFVLFRGNEYVNDEENNTLPDKIKAYTPLPFMEYTPKEYKNSDKFGDYRSWRLSKLIDILKDNPNNFDSLFKTIYTRNKKFVSKTYTYTEYPHIYERSIDNSKIHCGEDSELFVNFNSPQAFIQVYNASCLNTPCSMYFNGERKPYTHKMSFGSSLYVYFPIEYIANHEDIHIDIELECAPSEGTSIRFNSIDSEVMIDENDMLEKNSTSNLLLFNSSTNEIINITELSMKVSVDKTILRFIGIDKDNLTTFKDEEIYLYDNDWLLVVPTDADMIVLHSESGEDVEIVTGLYQKKIDLHKISFSTSNTSLCGESDVCIASTNEYRLFTTIVTEDYLNDKGSIFTINNYKGSHSSNNYFHVFYNGKIILPEKYTVSMSNTYNSSVTISIPSITSPGRVDIEYLGYDENIIYSGKVEDIMDDDGVIYIGDYMTTPFSTINTKIYINGYRVGNNCITELSSSDVISITGLPYEYTGESEILIFQQKDDTDPFNYLTTDRYMKDIIKENEDFKDYLKNIYE